VTSYALPPSTAFTLAPFSIYRKGASKLQSHRFTYASVTGSTQTDKPQLICFAEKSVGDRTETAKTTYTLDGAAQILALDALPVAAGGSSTSVTHDLLVTFDNGNAMCLSADLESVRWVAQLKLSSANERVEHVSTATAKAVTRGLLRNREDVATVLSPTSDEASDLAHLTQVLCVVGRKSDGTTTFSLVQVQPRSQDLSTTQRSPLKHLVSWNLPNTAQALPSMSSTQYSLHASTGVIHTLKGAALASYDLSGNVPKLYSEITLPGSCIDSFLRLSPDLVFTTAQQVCRIFDAKFGTLQAMHSLDLAATTPDAASPAKKRKLTQPETKEQQSAQVHLLAYYADQDLVVAIRGSEVVGLQLDASFTRKRAKTEGTLLSDALGKGIGLAQKNSNAQETPKWHERRAKLDRYASKGKIDKFEEAFAADLGIPVEMSGAQQKRENEVKGGPLTNGLGPSIPEEDAMAIDMDEDQATDDVLGTWKIPVIITDAQKRQSRQYASYALSKIFIVTDSTEDLLESRTLLKIQFFPPNVFQWLLQTGHLSVASVRRALVEEALEYAQVLSAATDGGIVQALVDFDPDLHILSAILNYRGHLPVGEVVQALKLLMQSLGEQPDEQNTAKMLTNGDAASEEEMDVDIASELEAATHEIDHALSVLDHGLVIRSHTLRPALIRLHSFSPRLITSTLRSMLPQRDLEALINLLHLEMRNGGWSSTYDSAELELSTTDSPNESPDDHAVAIIASLLSCTLDAIGAGAWLSSISSPTAKDSSEEIIDSLQSDTSEALNGFWEARYMRGLLGEFLRYASNVPKSHKPSNKSLELRGKPFAVSMDVDELPMLPLGAKPDMGIEKTKAGRGGKKEERSAREIGMMISKKVPKYSFERIVI
jgi:hypothetical protein